MYGLIYVQTVIIYYCTPFAAHNIPLQVNTDDGSMELDIPQGEPPKTNEQAENVMRYVHGSCVTVFIQELVFHCSWFIVCAVL